MARIRLLAGGLRSGMMKGYNITEKHGHGHKEKNLSKSSQLLSGLKRKLIN
jgi:hypothetical protein